MSGTKEKEIVFSLYIPRVNSNEEYIKAVFFRKEARDGFGVIEYVDIIPTHYENECAAVVHISSVVNNNVTKALKDGWAVRITHNIRKGSFWMMWHTQRKPSQESLKNTLSESQWPTLSK